jgi:hypothetical protein
MITTVIVWWQFFLLKKWTKVRAKFFYLILNFWFWYYFKSRPPVKMVDLLMVRWLPLYRLLTVLETFLRYGSQCNFVYNSSDIHRLLFKCDIYYSDVATNRYLQEHWVPVYDWIKKLHEASVVTKGNQV